MPRIKCSFSKFSIDIQYFDIFLQLPGSHSYGLKAEVNDFKNGLFMLSACSPKSLFKGG